MDSTSPSVFFILFLLLPISSFLSSSPQHPLFLPDLLTMDYSRLPLQEDHVTGHKEECKYHKSDALSRYGVCKHHILFWWLFSWLLLIKVALVRRVPVREIKNNVTKMLYPVLYMKYLGAKGIQVLIPWYQTSGESEHALCFEI